MYAQYVQRLRGRLGHFWQNRFDSPAMDEAPNDMEGCATPRRPIGTPEQQQAAAGGIGGDSTPALLVREENKKTAPEERRLYASARVSLARRG